MTLRNVYFYMFFGSVCIEKPSRNIDYRLSVPIKSEIRLLSHLRYCCRLEVFLSCELAEAIRIFCGDYYSHTFLRLAYGKLRSVKPLVFLGDLVQIHFKAVGKFAYSNGNAACAEVVAALYKPCRLGVAEEPLKLSFFRSITRREIGRASCRERV